MPAALLFVMFMSVSATVAADEGPSLGLTPASTDEEAQEDTADSGAESVEIMEETSEEPTPTDEPIDSSGEPRPIETSVDDTKPLNSEAPDVNDAPAEGDGDAMIREAYAQTKTAKSVEELTQLIELLKQALKATPNEENLAYGRTLLAWAHNRRGERYASQQEEDEALDDFATAVSLDPKAWRAFHNRGVSYALMGKYDEAIEDFDTAIALHGKYANTWYNRGELRYERGDYEGAVDDYTQTIRLAPQDPAAYNSRGHTYYRLKRFREAMQDYDRAVQLDPKNAAVMTNRGDAYAHQGNYAASARDFREAIQLDPELGRAYQSAAWLMSTCPDPRFRNPQLGLDAARRAIELDGEDDFRYLDTLAAAYANVGEFEQAVSVANQAIRKAPKEDAEALRGRLALYQNGKPYRENDGVSRQPVGPPSVQARQQQRRTQTLNGRQNRQPIRRPTNTRGRAATPQQR